MATDIIYSCAPSELSNVCVQVRSLNEGSMLKSYKGSSTDDRVGCIAVAGSHFLLGTMQTKPFIVVWALQKVSLSMHSCNLLFFVSCSSTTETPPPWPTGLTQARDLLQFCALNSQMTKSCKTVNVWACLRLNLYLDYMNVLHLLSSCMISLPRSTHI